MLTSEVYYFFLFAVAVLSVFLLILLVGHTLLLEGRIKTLEHLYRELVSKQAS